jgi:hypothetical protein
MHYIQFNSSLFILKESFTFQYILKRLLFLTAVFFEIQSFNQLKWNQIINQQEGDS